MPIAICARFVCEFAIATSEMYRTDSKISFAQVAASRPVAFYASLAKKLLLDNATVELSAIGASRITPFPCHFINFF
jgi:hypothetical protein